VLIFSVVALIAACAKSVGKDPSLAYTDKALYDSCTSTASFYYKNDPARLLSGNAGPHGTFKLRFNALAAKQLTDNGKLPANRTMPEGAMVIKDIYGGGQLVSYAYMYKRAGAWLWGEVTVKRQVTYSVKMDASVCTSCHQQGGNRDYIVSFNFY
jgi:hypothetical protein